MIACQSIMDDGLSQEGKDRLNSGGNYLEALSDGAEWYCDSLSSKFKDYLHVS